MSKTLKLIRKTIGKEIPKAGLTRNAVLTREVEGVATAGEETSGTNPGEETHRCKGLDGSYKEKAIDGTQILRGDRRLLIVGDSLPDGFQPAVDDRIAIGGRDYSVMHVGYDPAEAAYVCQGRR